MLVVCALALVVAASALLVMGLAGGDVGDLYLSMVLCVASLVVVAVSARLGRVRSAPAATEPPAPVAPAGTEPDAATVDEPAAGLGARPAEERRARPPEASIWAAGPSVPAPDPEPEPEVQPEPEVEADTAGFPIAEYDSLTVAQILPLVSELWPEEVPVVAARERATKARPAVLDALAGAAGDPSLAFPIAEYDSLDTEQITRLLNRLDDADLATVQAAERAGPARVGVLVAVANQLAARQ